MTHFTMPYFNRFVSANLQVNKFKNRLVNILPFESSRVCLQPLRGIEGSDYINASFIDGYRYRNAYIATQGPLNETVEDFWRMLWEHNSTIVVMLTKLREMGRVSQIHSCLHTKNIANFNPEIPQICHIFATSVSFANILV